MAAALIEDLRPVLGCGKRFLTLERLPLVLANRHSPPGKRFQAGQCGRPEGARLS
ncbi:hypothetical protein FHX82_005940 [Amycolatopsis bartoniae]|uniref:Uncharacterized protein n=1 Tax=Amycolatopsis bartoniae TaxID=941986 RepID=A0A8H9J5E2_9PSEU|nr:hypothetical protein [Amycolatopsis bartoniae]GHF77172.1 hypothetical protein GCM10017566_59210 [Amycolatopsis bartoniae]